MQTDKEFEELDAKCASLLIQIDKEIDKQKRIKLKKEFHRTKLEMINIIELEKESHGITARELIDKIKNMKPIPRYALGLSTLDEKFNGGIEVGTFIQIAGQSFAGKTHFILEVLSNISGYSECVLFNFEMGDRRIARRLDKLLITDTQLDNMIIDSRTRNIDDMINEIRIYARKGVRFFAIDSKMKITSSEKDDFKRFGEITSKLSRVCQENDIIVFLINQMSEDDMKNKRFAFKGSGDQLYDTDIALFLTVDKEDNRKLICTKNRQDEYGFVMNSFLVNDKLQFVEIRKPKVEVRDYIE